MEPKAYVRLINTLIKENKWDKVGKVCRVFVERKPNCVQSHFFSGLYHKHFNESIAALESFNKCIDIDINHFLSYINLIRILRDLNNFIEAYKYITIGKEKFPDNILIYIESSDFYLQINNINDAIIDIKIAIKLNPKSETAQYNYALILNKLYNDAITDEEIEEYYRKTLIQYMIVLSINRLNTFALCNYGAVVAKYAIYYNTKGDILITQAKQLYTEGKIIEANLLKEKANLYYMYATQYNMEAETKYMEVLDIDPLDYIAHSNLGLILKSFNQLDKAKFHFTKAIEINPEYNNAKIELDLCR